MLAARADISVNDTFTRMRTHARSRGLRLTAVASGVVAGLIDVKVLMSS